MAVIVKFVPKISILYKFVYLLKSTIPFSFPLMKISGPNVKIAPLSAKEA